MEGIIGNEGQGFVSIRADIDDADFRIDWTGWSDQMVSVGIGTDLIELA